ncbi:hypothetical protein HYALB_00014052 [Hymenoscyphus albidus]|uniref:Zn(2)-C6 fungal-type domain-containing protein n=1 Tax=Hymenoscyphus albidus TaxID=595503 RepID=A0A9N9M110_9HELO|nr:hypothetical protein HYALB_00014052 [Hymenoscyphus albidus]
MSSFSSAATPLEPRLSLSSQQPVAKPVRKRDKIQLSCTFCRRKKLKCDRNQPCRTCVGRGVGRSCTYIQNSPKFRSLPARVSQSTQNSQIQNKISQLEELVVSLMGSLNATKAVQPPPNSIEPTGEIERSGSAETHVLNQESLADNFGRITLENAGTKYVDNTHWTAILDGISELKDHFVEDPVLTYEIPPELQENSQETPLLLFGRKNHATKQEILAGLPPRNIADRLVAKYFNSWVMSPVLHRVTFLKEYERFWANPSQAPTMWIGLLFAIFCLSVNFQLVSQEDDLLTGNASHPAAEDAQITIQAYKEKIVQCLILAKYIKSLPYTIETLLLYLAVEHLNDRDAQIGTYILFGIVVRVSLRMGYHRDGSHTPDDLSPYQAEMRRRAWALIRGIDIAVSQQVGLPRMLREEIYDTAEPRNLMDENFDEDSLELPCSLPPTVLTPIYYITVKNTLLDVYATIMDFTAHTKKPLYSEITRLDAELCKVKENLPPPYQYKSMAQSLTDPTELLIFRITFEVTFHSANCHLHRSFMAIGRTNLVYKSSRHECLASAIQLLLLQHTFMEEIQPGGRLSEERWKLNSMINNQFLLGTTILCLDVNRTLEDGDVVDSCRNILDEKDGRELIVNAMMKGWRAWEMLSGKSQDAKKGANALKLVLGKINQKPGGPFGALGSKHEMPRYDGYLAPEPAACSSNPSLRSDDFPIYPSPGVQGSDVDMMFNFSDFDIPTDDFAWDDWDILQSISGPESSSYMGLAFGF